jgi:hypothetical protein
MVATIMCNTGPVAMIWALNFGPCRLQVLKLLYIVCFSVLVANSANVAMCNTRCPVATIHTGTVFMNADTVYIVHGKCKIASGPVHIILTA